MDSLLAWIQVHPALALVLYVVIALLVAIGADVVQKSEPVSASNPRDTPPLMYGLLWPAALFAVVGMAVLGCFALPIVGACYAVAWAIGRLGDLIAARFYPTLDPMDETQWEEQRRSFAHGNAALANLDVTREGVDRAAEALAEEQRINGLIEWSGRCPRQ